MYNKGILKMNLLLTSIGKRIQLIRHLQTAFRVVGADASDENAARHFTDAFYRIPKCREDGYVDALLDICRKEQINALVPLYEPEFDILNGARGRFEELGVHLLLSDERVIRISNSKELTAAFFEKYNIPAPYTYRDEEMTNVSFPVIVKPKDGMGSANVFRAETPEELEFFRQYVPHPIVQSCAAGTEYTVDVLCDEVGTPVYIVPRVRVEVRAGEVVKSRTEHQLLIVQETLRLLEALNREGRVIGPMTIQCFLNESATAVSFIEINARFGGGVPLSFAAGPDYATAMAQMIGERRRWTVRTAEEYLRDFVERTMLRYDEAVIV